MNFSTIMSSKMAQITNKNMFEKHPILILFYLFQVMEAQLNARIRHLKFGKPSMNLSMVTYVKNMSDLGINVIKYGLTATTKNVENFAKRHVTHAQVCARLKFVHNFSSEA